MDFGATGKTFKKRLASRRAGLISMGLFTSLICCGFSDPQGCNSGSGTGTIVAAGAVLGGAVVGTVILVEVHKSHHNVKGCVFSNPTGGLEVQTLGDTPTDFALSGDVPNLKVGDVVKLHGSKLKKKKGDPEDQTFAVEKLTRDYGPCKAPVKTAAELQKAKEHA